MIIGRIFILLGISSFILTLISNYFDIILQIDNKNEIFAESNLLNPNNLPDVIVIPDLLTPGIKARTWNKPITKADRFEKFSSIFFVILFLSAI